MLHGRLYGIQRDGARIVDEAWRQAIVQHGEHWHADWSGRIKGDALDEKRQHQLIGDFFSRVPAEVSGMQGETAEITSALPLTDAERQSATRLLGARDVQFKVDPSILGGLVVRVGDRVVDDSVVNRMNALQESLRR